MRLAFEVRAAPYRAAPQNRQGTRRRHPKNLIIPTGKRKGENPSLASIYRHAQAEYEKTQPYPEAIEQAHAEPGYGTEPGPPPTTSERQKVTRPPLSTPTGSQTYWRFRVATH
ncbi:hypothetical protein [Nonomuraea sp. GTA35]|uniref:hypothetical protein n=1 Tax=Nonomuraea sp. GTA35 TaxID=1676746 RepID=UPI0035C11979